MAKGATVGLVPGYTCPFDSTDVSVYVLDTDVSGGRFATEKGFGAGSGYEVTDAQVFYTCAVAADLGCYYVESPGAGVVLVGSLPAVDSPQCPQTLCSTSSGDDNQPPPPKRGIYLEGAQARIRRNQVDP